MKHKRDSGLTLVEVLIVVVVIAILASMAVFFYTNQQKQARDEKRKSDIIALQHELDKYFEANGNYPLSCDSYTTGSSSCSQVESSYSYGTPPPRIGKDTSITAIQAVLPGLADNFRDPLAKAGDNPINQHRSGSNYVKVQSYAFLSPDMSNTSTNLWLDLDTNGNSTLTCDASPYQYDYHGNNMGNRPHPYILGYFSEVENKWIFVHGSKSDELNNLRWNNSNKPACNPSML